MLAFKISSANYLLSLSIILFYVLGHCSIIIIAGTFTSLVRNYLNWNENSKGTVILKKICGILVIIGGMYLIYNTM